jgi:predicted N-formylglutamate amidohydrolase
MTRRAAPAEAFQVVNAQGGAPFLLLCDHASNVLPPAYGTLGLPAEAFTRHIAYDIGAAALTRALAVRLGAPAILTAFSRLLIDANRGEDDPTLIMALSDGAVIPGNHPLDEGERRARVARYYRPYHAAIAAALDSALARGVTPALLSIHSFTPAWKGKARPWHVGVLWNRDGRLALPLLDALAAEGDLVVGDNEPYSGELKGDCMDRHGTARGLPHVLIEIRQDLIGTEAGVAAMAERLERVIRGLDMTEWSKPQ